MRESIAEAADLLKPARKILVFSGAGISTESGIADFRGPEGLWTRMDPDEFTIDRYLQDPQVRKKSWAMHQQGLFGRTARPNQAHYEVVRLWQHNRMAGCVTQNIDGLHQAAGLPEEQVAELHGNARTVHCTACPASWAVEEILDRLAAGDRDPACQECGAVVKSSMVLFGELLPEPTFQRAVRMATSADAVLAVGTTLSVFPAADLVLVRVSQGANLIIVNRGATAFDHLAGAILDGPAGEVLPDLVDAIVE